MAAMSPTEPASHKQLPYDAVLLVSFGGPEGPDDVMPFLEKVTRGRNVPRERLLAVAEHYRARGGISPINGQCRSLLDALRRELAAHGHAFPVYWGNRNWHPLLADTMTQMATDGIRRAIAFVTSANSSYSSCRQYLDDVAGARLAAGPRAPVVDKIRQFYDHPGFIEPMAERVDASLARLGSADRARARFVFCAHSIPVEMARRCDYESQVREAARLVADRIGGSHVWDLVFQSRSGPPQVPWLEPDVCDHLRALAASGERAVVLVPIGFTSDHMEVVHDLDTEALAVAAEDGLAAVRAPTVGTHPRFVSMIRELIEERLDPSRPRLALGRLGVRPDVCPPGCCPAPARPSVRPGTGSMSIENREAK
jgi:protoporphyrin/coproporphyrin ferrochelatase